MMIRLVELNCNLRKRSDGVWNILVFPKIQGDVKSHNNSDVLGNICSFLHHNPASLLRSLSFQDCCSLKKKVLKGIY